MSKAPFQLDARKHRVFGAIAAHNRHVLADTAAFIASCMTSGILRGYSSESGSGINVARNKLTAKILAAKCKLSGGAVLPLTHIMSIDSDVNGQPEHVLKLLEHSDRGGIHCAPYPHKSDELKFAYNTLDGQGLDVEPDTGLAEIKYGATGFMLIPLTIIQHMIREWPELEYTDDDTHQKAWAIWDDQVVEVSPGYRRFLTEDWLFCHRARLLGYKIWLQTDFMVNHIGCAVYPTLAQRNRIDLEKQLEELGQVPCTKQKNWPANIIAAGIHPDHCADVLAGAYDIPQTALASLGSKPPRVLDVGANIGAFARWALKRWPGCRVHCYEPDPKNYELLCSTISGFPKGTEVSALPHAVLNRDGRMPLYRGAGNCGECSLFDVGGQTKESIEVPLITACDLPTADILKIDTEGSEWPILYALAGVDRLREFLAIMLEFHSAEDRVRITDLLLSAGFRLHAERIHSPCRGELKFIRAAPGDELAKG